MAITLKGTYNNIPGGTPLSEYGMSMNPATEPVRTLPNGGGTFQGSKITPAPVVVPPHYTNPATGQLLSAKEIVANMAKKIPTRNADVATYAGDAMVNPDQSAESLTKTGRVLNNARNDIATGATDPYKVGTKSGIAYSPAELAAIEKAYAGVYDPAINDVFTRLKTREEEKAALAKREEQIFSTNESIRQWKATTGSKKTSGEDLFTQSQLNNGASNSGLGIDTFSTLDSDIQNFFINPPNDVDEVTGKSYPMTKTFGNLVKLVQDGEMTAQEATNEIMSSNLPDTVKHYYIDQLPLTVEEKKGYWSKLWGAVTGN